MLFLTLPLNIDTISYPVIERHVKPSHKHPPRLFGHSQIGKTLRDLPTPNSIHSSFRLLKRNICNISVDNDDENLSDAIAGLVKIVKHRSSPLEVFL